MAAHPPKHARRTQDSSSERAPHEDGGPRCDVLAVVRDCIDHRLEAWEAKGIQAGIELPCGPLPWLALEEPALRRMLEGALDSVSKRARQGSLSVALWCDAMPPDRGCLRVEAYADAPAAGMSLDIALERAPSIPHVPSAEPPGRALLVEEHPARRRILRAQCARLGLDAAAPVTAERALDAAAATSHRLIWLGDTAGADPAVMAAAMRRAERTLSLDRARVVALRDAHPLLDSAHPDIDAIAQWPLSLDRLRALCAAAPWPGGDAMDAMRQLFLHESRRDAAIIRDAIAAGDWPTVVRHAHRIKGGTVVIGADEICERAERVEQAARQAFPGAAHMAVLLSALEEALGGTR